MADDALARLLETQQSLTEWLADINHKDAESIRLEDNEKRERLRVLNDLIGLPFDKPVQFEATELAANSATFQAYFKANATELCALRLIPKQPELPKLRMRGKTVAGAYDWFLEQKVDPAKYKADFIPHIEVNTWATIFIVNKHGIQGEIITGGHHQLTQGFHDGAGPMLFMYDYKEWTVEPHNPDALKHLKKVAELIHVPNKAMQTKIKLALGASFAHDYLEGYFESTDSPQATWFIDYNQSLGKMYGDAVLAKKPSNISAIVQGKTGSPGRATGTVCVVTPDNLAIKLPADAVLVCNITTPDYVPLMQTAKAIVTDQGGVLSHAAIVARELKKPCLVGTGNATQVLKDGDKILVDADNGVVTNTL